MTLEEIKGAIQKNLPVAYWSGIWSRSTPAGIEVGVNFRNKEGSRAAMVPIDDESRQAFGKFLATEVLKYDTPISQ